MDFTIVKLEETDAEILFDAFLDRNYTTEFKLFKNTQFSNQEFKIGRGRANDQNWKTIHPPASRKLAEWYDYLPAKTQEGDPEEFFSIHRTHTLIEFERGIGEHEEFRYQIFINQHSPHLHESRFAHIPCQIIDGLAKAGFPEEIGTLLRKEFLIELVPHVAFALGWLVEVPVETAKEPDSLQVKQKNEERACE